MADKERKAGNGPVYKTIPKDSIPNNGETDSIIIPVKITWGRREWRILSYFYGFIRKVLELKFFPNQLLFTCAKID